MGPVKQWLCNHPAAFAWINYIAFVAWTSEVMVGYKSPWWLNSIVGVVAIVYCSTHISHVRQSRKITAAIAQLSDTIKELSQCSEKE